MCPQTTGLWWSEEVGLVDDFSVVHFYYSSHFKYCSFNPLQTEHNLQVSGLYYGSAVLYSDTSLHKDRLRQRYVWSNTEPKHAIITHFHRACVLGKQCEDLKMDALKGTILRSSSSVCLIICHRYTYQCFILFLFLLFFYSEQEIWVKKQLQDWQMFLHLQYKNKCTRTCTNAHAYKNLCTHTHAITHTHTHTHTHTAVCCMHQWGAACVCLGTEGRTGLLPLWWWGGTVLRDLSRDPVAHFTPPRRRLTPWNEMSPLRVPPRVVCPRPTE